MSKTTHTSVKIPDEILKKLISLANKDERKLHGYINLVLKRHVEAKNKAVNNQ